MERLKFRIHPTFIVFACLLCYFKQSFLFINYLIVMILHELAHAFVARKLGYKIKNITLIPFGICLSLFSNKIQAEDEIKIAIAGPLLNLFLCLLCLALWWICPSSYNVTYLFCCANFVTAIFNFLPAFPLDGGRVILAIFKKFFEEKKAIKLSKLLSLCLILLLFAMFVISCFIDINFTYLFVIFCLLSGFSKNEKFQYSFIDFSRVKKAKKVVKLKNLYVSENENLYKIYKYIDNFSFLNLYIYNYENHLIQILSENEYLNLIEKYEATLSFNEALKSYNSTF